MSIATVLLGNLVIRSLSSSTPMASMRLLLISAIVTLQAQHPASEAQLVACDATQSQDVCNSGLLEAVSISQSSGQADIIQVTTLPHGQHIIEQSTSKYHNVFSVTAQINIGL